MKQEKRDRKKYWVTQIFWGKIMAPYKCYRIEDNLPIDDGYTLYANKRIAKASIHLDTCYTGGNYEDLRIAIEGRLIEVNKEIYADSKFQSGRIDVGEEGMLEKWMKEEGITELNNRPLSYDVRNYSEKLAKRLNGWAGKRRWI